jgi:hypothetical protein
MQELIYLFLFLGKKAIVGCVAVAVHSDHLFETGITGRPG